MKFLSDEGHPSLPCSAILVSAIILFFPGMVAVSPDGASDLCTKVKFSISPSSPLNAYEANLYGLEKESTVTFTCSAESINGTIRPTIKIFSNTESGLDVEGVSKGWSLRLVHGANSNWSKGKKIQEVVVGSSTLSFKLWETTCDHEGTWKCVAVYQYLDTGNKFTYGCRGELMISRFPKNLRISFQPQNSSYYLGDSIKVLCTGFIGSMDASWVIESRTPDDPDGEWPKHYDKFWETSPKRLSECRTISGAVLLINITENDDGRVFRCFLKRPGHWFANDAAPSLPVILHKDSLTKKPLPRPQPQKSNECSVKVWSIFGATIGGVLIFVIVIEVSYYFIVVWRQKNSRRPSLFPDLPTGRSTLRQ